MDENKVYSPSNVLSEGVDFTDGYLRVKTDGSDMISFYDESVDHKYNPILRKFLYNQRIRNNKQMILRYKQIKEEIPFIYKAFIDPERYKELNIFVDLSYYHDVFMQNNIYKLDKAVNIYFDFICRLLDSKKLKSVGYSKYTVFIPVTESAWKVENGSYLWDYKKNLNPISTIVRLTHMNPNKLKEEFGKYQFLFINDKGYFTVDFNNFGLKELPRFINAIKLLLSKDEVIVDDGSTDKDSPKAIVATIVDKLEDNQKIKINNLTGTSKATAAEIKDRVDNSTYKSSDEIEKQSPKERDKDALVEKIKKTAEKTGNLEDTIKELDNDDYIKKILADLSSEEDDSVKINATRTTRMARINDKFINKELRGRKISDLLKEKEVVELPKESLPVDSINDEWKDMTFINFDKEYDLDSDIVKIINSFSDKTIKIGILDIQVEDSSNTEDLKETYTVKCEDQFGKRFAIKFDVPKLRDHRFMRLRGNDKIVNGQLILLPVIKTDNDTVQIVSCYSKIFVRRFGSTIGKSYVIADRIIKALNKGPFKGLDVTTGDNTRICAKYELPIDYIDLASQFTNIENERWKVYFNQDELRANYKVDDSLGLPIGIYKPDNKVVYYNADNDYGTASEYILDIISEANKEFRDAYNAAKPGVRYTYSKASILRNEIPIIVILGYNIGLQAALTKAGINYEFTEKLDSNLNKERKDYIRFKDGYLVYDLNYNSSMLMNGLKECDTLDYSLADINKKTTWLDFLDNFGGRILADGLDNFYDCMVDPITEEVCIRYKLPTEYCDLLIYANNLLADNKFNRHVDITGNRYRSNEIIADYVYKALSKAYGDYHTQLKRNRNNATMSVKRSAVIEMILTSTISSDLSILNPLLEQEAANTVSFKGPSGMNSDRSYGLDKRTYDDTMLNVLALSTGFSANVGINRQATIDMNIESTRGYIKTTKDVNNMNITKSFSMTEALTPFGTTRDDPFRTAMTFIQTSKHGMRVKKAMPQFISTGADEALPYMTSDVFSFKAKDNGKVVELDDDHMILEYKDGSHDFVDLRENVKKNSDGGFFVTLKLDPDVKFGSTFKKGQIVAHDPSSFTGKIGHKENLSYNIGTMAKTVIMTTDEGYEDSTKVSMWLSDAMSSDIVLAKTVTLPSNTNVYYIVNEGQEIQEGDPLIVFQNAFEEKDVNVLLKNITDEDDLVSELGRIPIKSKVTGVVQHITIYRTVDYEDLSITLKKIVKPYEDKINRMKRDLKKYGIEDTTSLEPTETLEPIGKLKHASDSVMIEFYLKYGDKLGIGDKIVGTSAAKGVIKDLIPEGLEPTSEYRPDEKIHAMFAVGSFNARMITSVFAQGLINKGIIELDRKVKDIMGVDFKYIDDLE